METIPGPILTTYPAAYEVLIGDFNRAYLYLLIDPKTDAVRWIGKSTSPGARLSAHLSEASSSAGCLNQKKNAWIEELQSLGLLPRMIVVKEGPVLEILAEEKRLIAEALAAGLPVLNGRKPRGKAKK